jgi:hypothetical protein
MSSSSSSSAFSSSLPQTQSKSSRGSKQSSGSESKKSASSAAASSSSHDAVDKLFQAISNPAKQRPKNTEEQAEKALTSDERKNIAKAKRKQKLMEALSSSSSSSSGGSGSGSATGSGSDEAGDKKNESTDESDRLEKEMDSVIKKARLLGRIQQLTQKGGKPSKVFDHRSSTYEMKIEIARMEVVAERGARIKQGRMMLLATSATIEKSCKMWDRYFYDYVTFQVEGITKDTLMSISDYDDALEEAVEDLIGPQGKIPWYYRISALFASNMYERSLLNRSKQTPEHSAQVMARDPELRERVSLELARAEKIAQGEAETRMRRTEMQRGQDFTAPATATGFRMSAPPPVSMPAGVTVQ